MLTLDRQNALDVAVLGIIEQGKRALEGTLCRYRTRDGRKCAIGMLIPDEKYEPDMESMTTRAIFAAVGIFLKSKEDEDFLRSLRDCHDTAQNDFIPTFIYNTRKLAAEWGLIHPIPE